MSFLFFNLNYLIGMFHKLLCIFLFFLITEVSILSAEEEGAPLEKNKVVKKDEKKESTLPSEENKKQKEKFTPKVLATYSLSANPKKQISITVKDFVLNRFFAQENSSSQDETLRTFEEQILSAPYTSRKGVIDELIFRRVVLEEAQKSGIKKSKEFVEHMKNVEELSLVNMFLEQEVKKTVTQEAKDKAYEQYVLSQKDQKEFLFQRILIESEDKASLLYKKVTARGADFLKIAKENAQDSENNNFEVGYVGRYDLTEQLYDLVSKMGKNEISKPFKTEQGWVIIKLLDSRPFSVGSREDMENELSRALEVEALKKYRQDFLSNKLNIKYN